MYCTVKEIIREVLDTDVPDSECVFAVVLTVEAVNPQGGRRVFTSRDYPEFIVTDPAAVDFFKYFTKQNHE